MIDRNLDHDRASYSYECVEAIKKLRNDSLEKKYRSAVHSSGALIQKSGLMQTLSFYISKKNDSHYERLAGHILNWNRIHGRSENLLDSYHNLLKLPDEEIINKTQEAKALILWLKRFADTMLKGEK